MCDFDDGKREEKFNWHTGEPKIYFIPFERPLESYGENKIR